MKSLLFILLSSLILNSCNTIECPEYNFTHSINQWNMFPNNELEYNYFNSNDDKIILKRENFEYNAYVEKDCYYCSCFSLLKNKYINVENGIHLENMLDYTTKEMYDSIGVVYYFVNKKSTHFVPDGLSLKIRENDKSRIAYNLTFHNNLNLIKNSYSNVTELEIIDTTHTNLRKLWVVQNKGLIAFQLNQEIWEKE